MFYGKLIKLILSSNYWQIATCSTDLICFSVYLFLEKDYLITLNNVFNRYTNITFQKVTKFFFSIIIIIDKDKLTIYIYM